MTVKPYLSIALCTYNGARYLSDQLASIAAQTRLPDELVACDDRSTDNTIAIINEFASHAAFPVRVFVNERTLGSTKNFEKAIGLCEGDVIVFSDQDDVWFSQKLARIEAAFSESPMIGAVFSDAEMVDERLQLLGVLLWEAVRFTPLQQKAFAQGRTIKVLLKHNVVTGATLAFRAEHRPLILPIPNGWVHDGWIALLIAATTELAMLPEPLVKYRQHAGQQLGAPKRSLRRRWQLAQETSAENYLQIATQYETARARLASLPIGRCRIEALQMLGAKISHFRRRAGLPRGKLTRLPTILSELAAGQYHRYSYGWTSAAKDFWF
jgi:glycosyltransferase involved in cell wall biosynthesis